MPVESIKSLFPTIKVQNEDTSSPKYELPVCVALKNNTRMPLNAYIHLKNEKCAFVCDTCLCLWCDNLPIFLFDSILAGSKRSYA